MSREQAPLLALGDGWMLLPLAFLSGSFLSCGLFARGPELIFSPLKTKDDPFGILGVLPLRSFPVVLCSAQSSQLGLSPLPFCVLRSRNELGPAWVPTPCAVASTPSHDTERGRTQGISQRSPSLCGHTSSVSKLFHMRVTFGFSTVSAWVVNWPLKRKSSVVENLLVFISLFLLKYDHQTVLHQF